MIEISILILTRNEAKNIGPCLDAVFSQRSDKSFEVVVIDSSSSDDTLKIANRFPVSQYLIEQQCFHHARTRNYAAGLAQGQFLVYLAADAFPTSSAWLGSIVADFNDPAVGAVYGRHLPKPNSTLERRMVLDTVYGPQKIVKEPSRRQDLGYRYYHFSTVNAAIRKSVWSATQFPEDLKVFEDVGIAKRILDDGWKIVYEPSASVYHSHDHNLRGLFKRYFDMGVVYSRLHLLDEGGKSSMFRAGLRSLRHKVARRNGNDAYREAVTSVLYNAGKYAGFVLGRNEKLVPLALKKRWSAFGLFD
jgi:rhamnosyltransferase